MLSYSWNEFWGVMLKGLPIGKIPKRTLGSPITGGCTTPGAV
jgi:hypothetical protein